MENTFNPLFKEYRCKNAYQSFQVMEDLYESVGDITFWVSKVNQFQNGVFGTEVDFEAYPPDCYIYSGQLFLKLIYAGLPLQQFPPITKDELTWEVLVGSLIKRLVKNQGSEPAVIHFLEYGPKHLSIQEVLDPSSFLREFYARKSVSSWVRRWNQFRECVFYQYSIMDGDEGEFLKDFSYFFRLTEATYLIHARNSSTQNSNNDAAI